MSSTTISSVGLWSAVIQPQQILVLNLGASLMLTNATLPLEIPKKDDKFTRSTLKISYRLQGFEGEGASFSGANLLPRVTEQVTLKVLLIQGYEYFLESKGYTEIHLLGRFIGADQTSGVVNPTVSRILIRAPSLKRTLSVVHNAPLQEEEEEEEEEEDGAEEGEDELDDDNEGTEQVSDDGDEYDEDE